MALKSFVVFNSAVDQMQNSAKNLESIQNARLRLRQQQELLSNKKKESDLRLKNLELTGEGTALQNQMLKTQMDEYFKQQKAVQDGHTATINMEEQNQTSQAKQAGEIAKAAYQSDPQLQLSVAQRLNPRLGAVPGPEGGTVVGQMGYDMMDNTPEAVDPNPLEPKYVGGKIARFERAGSDEKKATYNDIVKMAQDMAKDDAGPEPLGNKIKKYIPQARSILTKSNVEEFDGPRTPGLSMDQVYKQDDPAAKQKDQFGYSIGEERDFEGKGKHKYLGNNRWQRLK